MFRLKLAAAVDGLQVVEKGLQPGDKVVIDGQANLVTGSKIRIKTGGNDANAAGNNSSTPGKRRRSAKPAGGDS